MGDVIPLFRRRSGAPSPTTRAAARPDGAGGPRVTFYFDLASPWTYLAAERAERLFGAARWRPAMGEALLGGRRAPDAREESERVGGPCAGGPGAPDARGESGRAAAERRAAELRLPLVWPEAWPDCGRGAMR